MKTQITITFNSILAIVVVTMALMVAVPAQSVMIVDRGLPTINLNVAAGELRSNTFLLGTAYQQYFYGDDFTVPASGSRYWRIDTIRVWFVGGVASGNNGDMSDDSFLGDQSLGKLSLWVGTNGRTLNRVSLASFLPGRDAANNPNVVARRVQYYGGIDYERPDVPVGAPWPYLTIIQLDFTNLNVICSGGTKVQFGMTTDGNFSAHPHASSAVYSGSTQDQANNIIGYFMLDPVQPKKDPTARFLYSLAKTDAWGKPSDINVQVLATLVNKPR